MCFELGLDILVYKKVIAVPHLFNKTVSFIEKLIHLILSLVQQFLSRLPRSRWRQYLFISSGNSFLPLKLFTASPKEKSSHTKTHLPDWFRICAPLIPTDPHWAPMTPTEPHWVSLTPSEPQWEPLSSTEHQWPPFSPTELHWAPIIPHWAPPTTQRPPLSPNGS